MDAVVEELVADADADAATGRRTRIFPRVKERDPYRRPGISAEASFEEVQDEELPRADVRAQWAGGRPSRTPSTASSRRSSPRARNPGRARGDEEAEVREDHSPRFLRGSRAHPRVRMTPRSCAGR